MIDPTAIDLYAEVEASAKALEATIKANAPPCISRDHAIEKIGDVLHCAYYAIALGRESDTPGVPA